MVLDAVGTPRLVSRIRRAHANPLLPYDTAPSLAIGLGGVGVTLRDLVSIYAAMARGGIAGGLARRRRPVPPEGRATPAPVLDPVAAWYVANVLADVPPPLNGSPGRIAYKTGTSYGYRDAWAVGYDGKTVIGVWVGRPDGAPVPGISGVKAAAPILFESFDRLGMATTPLRAPPQGRAGRLQQRLLPLPLKRFRHPDDDKVARDAAPEIAFPAMASTSIWALPRADAPLIVKVRNGVPPFTFFAHAPSFGRLVRPFPNWPPSSPMHWRRCSWVPSSVAPRDAPLGGATVAFLGALAPEARRWAPGITSRPPCPLSRHPFPPLTSSHPEVMVGTASSGPGRSPHLPTPHMSSLRKREGPDGRLHARWALHGFLLSREGAPWAGGGQCTHDPSPQPPHPRCHSGEGRRV